METTLKRGGIAYNSARICSISGILAMLLLIYSCSSKHEDHHQIYICPMHPTIVSDHKGTCPVCGMELVLQSRDGDGTVITDDVARLLKSPNEVVVTSIKTIRPEFRSMSGTIDAEGIVTYDTKHIYTISTRTSGRLEKVFLKYAYQTVTKGQKIAEIYSPELQAARRELLFLADHDTGNTQLLDAAKHKLELLGLSASQVAETIHKKQVNATVTIFSPYTGYLIDQEQNMTPATQSLQPDEMGSSKTGETNDLPEPGKSIVREGQYVESGQLLFRIVSDNAYRIELDLPASQASSIIDGDLLELDFLNGHVHNAKVDFVQPFFSNGQSFIKIRVYTNKMEGLHIGHLVKTKIKTAGTESIWLPRSAVLYLGNESIVFVKTNGVFKPHKVQTGNASGDFLQIIAGVASSDEVAANAHFLVDSESFIKSDSK